MAVMIRKYILIAAFFCAAALAQAQNFSIPRPPKSLTQIPARAGWIVEHYWDNADMGALALEEQQAKAGNPSALEQAFVNYIALFPLTQSDSLCNAAVGAMMQKADSANACREIFALANKYLFDLDSPMADEEHFIFFLNAARETKSISPVQRQECSYWESVVNNNRVGSQIEDFCFETPQGKLMDFSDTQGERLLLLFDTECEDCRAMIESLKGEERQVVAIAVNSNRKAFRAFAKSLPDSWISGWDSTGTINGGAFALRHLPDLFLISPQGTVLQKHIKNKVTQ